MIPILHEFESNPGPRRFSELQKKLGIPQTTLTDRLQELTDLGFISRKSYDEIPPRVEYTATEKTADLAPAFEYLCRWGIHHDY
ncbi:winged helix-turn-helix transcriptional regulator [Haloferacaceae archaeon DSL9]